MECYSGLVICYQLTKTKTTKKIYIKGAEAPVSFREEKHDRGGAEPNPSPAPSRRNHREGSGGRRRQRLIDRRRATWEPPATPQAERERSSSRGGDALDAGDGGERGCRRAYLDRQLESGNLWQPCDPWVQELGFRAPRVRILPQKSTLKRVLSLEARWVPLPPIYC